MIKTVPYINTIGTDKFKEFLRKPFEIDLLYSVTKNSSSKVIFDGWKGKNMSNWYKFANENDCILEFYVDNYMVKKPINKLKLAIYQLPLPQTINDFINDMNRLGIDLYWNDNIDDEFEPKDYLAENEIEKYFFNLLNKMGKANEIL